MTRRQAFSRIFGFGAIAVVAPRPETEVTRIHVSPPHGDVEFARCLARAIRNGGNVKSAWQNALK